MQLFAEVTSGTILLMGAGLVSALLLAKRTQRQFRKVAASHEPKKRVQMPCEPQDLRAQAKSMQSLEQWEVRMHDLARELSGQLDAKLSALEHLIRDADARIAELARLSSATAEAGAASVSTEPLRAPHFTHVPGATSQAIEPRQPA